MALIDLQLCLIVGGEDDPQSDDVGGGVEGLAKVSGLLVGGALAPDPFRSGQLGGGWKRPEQNEKQAEHAPSLAKVGQEGKNLRESELIRRPLLGEGGG